MRAILVVIGGALAFCGIMFATLIGIANGMSDAPTERGVSVAIPLAVAVAGAGLIVYAVML